MADSDVYSSNLPHSRLVPDSVETLDGPSSPMASTETQVDRDNQDSISITPPNSVGSSSFTLDETLCVPSLEHGECRNVTQVMPESQIVSNNNSFQIASDDTEDVFWDECMSDLPETHESLFLAFQQLMEPIGVGAGLWNSGNTCFLNSVLQCLTHTVPLIQSLRSYTYHYPCNCGNEEFCVIRVLRGHISYALRPSRYPLSPDYFLDNLNYFSPEFQRYQQEDAHEFLQAFLNKLEGCCLDDQTSYRGYTSSQDGNIVEHVFGGRLISGLRCCKCNTVSETFENSLGLSLEIEEVDNLWSALESFTRVEKLDEQLTCDNCNEKVSKEKQLLLDKLPLVATFHLKRFKINGNFMEKIFKHVNIPLELDLQPYMRSTQENDVPTKYHLYALVEHLGHSLAHGHYTSYVRSAPKIWYQFDDVQVTRIDEESVLSHDPYILFYAREGTSWFSKAYEELLQVREASLQDSSPKSVLDSTNAEYLSEISYENVERSNKPCDSVGLSSQHAKTELTDDVCLSAESSGEYSPMRELLDPLETDDSYYPWTEKEPHSCLAIERATTDDELFPLFMAQNHYSSPEQQEGSFQIQLEQSEETTKNQEEPCKQPLFSSDVADLKETKFDHRDLIEKHSPRAREFLDQAITTTVSPPKKLKKKHNKDG